MTKREHFEMMRANYLHLIDLKRGGYSPSRTELVVDAHDRILAQPAVATPPAPPRRARPRTRARVA